MNRVTISVPKDIDLIFRKKAAIKFSFRRGWYGKAVLEAMKLWITHQTISQNRSQNLSHENKDYLWNVFREDMQVDSDDPYKVLDSIIEYFIQDIKFAKKITYELNNNKVLIKKQDSLEPYIPELITKENNSIFFNCPVKAIADAALKDITGQEYEIISSAPTLIHGHDEFKPQETEASVKNSKSEPEIASRL